MASSKAEKSDYRSVATLKAALAEAGVTRSDLVFASRVIGSQESVVAKVGLKVVALLCGEMLLIDRASIKALPVAGGGSANKGTSDERGRA